ncbi:hypothetical protein HY988_07450 [Candidatus Micrarchaeota archaeon]|nr:hypothetical protein [Candidatus Micrarchaeota archaeon]
MHAELRRFRDLLERDGNGNPTFVLGHQAEKMVQAVMNRGNESARKLFEANLLTRDLALSEPESGLLTVSSAKNTFVDALNALETEGIVSTIRRVLTIIPKVFAALAEAGCGYEPSSGEREMDN